MDAAAAASPARLLRRCAEHIGRLSSGDGTRLQNRSRMSVTDAHALAFSLAATLMAVIVIFKAGEGT